MVCDDQQMFVLKTNSTNSKCELLFCLFVCFALPLLKEFWPISSGHTVIVFVSICLYFLINLIGYNSQNVNKWVI